MLFGDVSGDPPQRHIELRSYYNVRSTRRQPPESVVEFVALKESQTYFVLGFGSEGIR